MKIAERKELPHAKTQRRQDTQSRIATLFGKIGILSHTWDATLSYSGADNRIYQAGSLPESLLAVNPRDNFTGGDYFAPRAHLAILNAQRWSGTLCSSPSTLTGARSAASSST